MWNNDEKVGISSSDHSEQPTEDKRDLACSLMHRSKASKTSFSRSIVRKAKSNTLWLLQRQVDFFLSFLSSSFFTWPISSRLASHLANLRDRSWFERKFSYVKVPKEIILKFYHHSRQTQSETVFIWCVGISRKRKRRKTQFSRNIVQILHEGIFHCGVGKVSPPIAFHWP